MVGWLLRLKIGAWISFPCGKKCGLSVWVYRALRHLSYLSTRGWEGGVQKAGIENQDFQPFEALISIVDSLNDLVCLCCEFKRNWVGGEEGGGTFCFKIYIYSSMSSP